MNDSDLLLCTFCVPVEQIGSVPQPSISPVSKLVPTEAQITEKQFILRLEPDPV